MAAKKKAAKKKPAKPAKPGNVKKAKKTASKSSTGVGTVPPKVAGLKFAIAGSFKTESWIKAADMKEMILGEGGVVGPVKKDTDYVVLGDSGASADKARASVEGFNADGGSIQIIGPYELLELLRPTPQECEAMLLGGEVERFNRTCGTKFHFGRKDDRGVASLEDADLREANLQFVSFRHVSLDGADLSGHDLKRIDLPRKIEGATLDGVSIDENHIKLIDCSLRNVKDLGSFSELIRCDLTDGSLNEGSGYADRIEGCNFKNADLSSVFLKGVEISTCDFTGVDFSEADMEDNTFFMCSFKNAKFNDANLAGCRFKGGNVNGADFSGANLIGTKFEDVDLSRARNLDDDVPEAGPILEKLNKVAKDFTTQIECDGVIWLVDLSDFGGGIAYSIQGTQPLDGADLAQGMLDAKKYLEGGKLILDSMQVPSYYRNKLPADKYLRLAAEAWCETLGQPLPTDADYAAAKAEREDKQVGFAEGLKKKGPNSTWAKMEDAKALCDADRNLSGQDLSEGSLRFLRFKNCNFQNADFHAADLRDASFHASDLRGAEFADANLSSLQAYESDFRKCNFQGAKHKDVELHKCDLRGADLSTLKLGSMQLDGCTYDHNTKVPANFVHKAEMVWKGKGDAPGMAAALKKVAGKKTQTKNQKGKKVDVSTFIEKLEDRVDASRYKKAIKMLKADRFELFVDVQDNYLTGVVKSQTDKDLVYACKLADNGKFTCCTQNLNPCGGLRGKLCKHLLVLIIGLAKAEKIEAATLDTWVDASLLNQPELDKDAMGETLLRYKGAEAGDVDWRPTETVPEDFMAF